MGFVFSFVSHVVEVDKSPSWACVEYSAHLDTELNIYLSFFLLKCFELPEHAHSQQHYADTCAQGLPNVLGWAPFSTACWNDFSLCR